MTHVVAECGNDISWRLIASLFGTNIWLVAGAKTAEQLLGLLRAVAAFVFVAFMERAVYIVSY